MESAAVFADALAGAQNGLRDASRAAQEYDQWQAVDSSQSTQSVAVTILAARADWLVKGLQSLAAFRKLKPNWDSYGAAAPTEVAVGLARHVLSILAEMDLPPSSIDPSAEGGVCISFLNGDRYGDVECFNTGEVLAVTSAPDSEPNVWRVESEPHDIMKAVANIKSFVIR